MSKRKNIPGHGIVYSTDPAFRLSGDEEALPETVAPGQQPLRLRLDTKQRAGKAVTLVEGFKGGIPELEALGKQLKTICGTGGSVKEGVIIIQGDNREKLLQWLTRNGYVLTKKI